VTTSLFPPPLPLQLCAASPPPLPLQPSPLQRQSLRPSHSYHHPPSKWRMSGGLDLAITPDASQSHPSPIHFISFHFLSLSTRTSWHLILSDIRLYTLRNSKQCLSPFYHHPCSPSLARFALLFIAQANMPYVLLYALLTSLTYYFLGPALFSNCEEHQLKSFGYAYVSPFLPNIHNHLGPGCLY
jgi:hypothetical protein